MRRPTYTQIESMAYELGVSVDVIRMFVDRHGRLPRDIFEVSGIKRPTMNGATAQDTVTAKVRELLTESESPIDYPSDGESADVRRLLREIEEIEAERARFRVRHLQKAAVIGLAGVAMVGVMLIATGLAHVAGVMMIAVVTGSLLALFGKI